MATVLVPHPIVLGAAVRAERVRRGWTQAQLAERAGVSRGFVSGVESGRRPRAGVAKVWAVVRAVGYEIRLEPQPQIEPTVLDAVLTELVRRP